MTLLIEVAGVLLIARALPAVLGGRADTAAAVTGALVIGVVAAGLTFWSGVWSEGNTLVMNHDSNAKLTRDQANWAAGGQFPANEGLLEFADSKIPRGAKVYLFCGPSQVGCDGEWISYRLSPRLFVATPQQAQWALIYGGTPQQAAFARGWQQFGFDAHDSVAKAPA